MIEWALSNEHTLIGAGLFLLFLLGVRAHQERKEYLASTQAIQEAAVALVEPLLAASARHDQDIRSCLRRVEVLEDSLARFTQGWHLIELDYRQRGKEPPWRPSDADLHYVGRRREIYQ